MSGQADSVERDERDGVFRVRTAAGVLLGTELGGLPCAYDSAAEAQDVIDRRLVLAPLLGSEGSR